jgi:cytochrome c biogenesis protein CcmG, thiol:disulfide interchange protein DsbE
MKTLVNLASAKFFRMLIIVVIILSFSLFPQDKPDLNVKIITNKQIKLSSLYSEGPTLVTFWALWCVPCKEELRHLKDIYEKYHAQGFNILSLNQDSPKSVSKVRAYVASQRIKFYVGLDPDFQYMQKLNGQSIPYSLLFDKKGDIVYKQVGYLPGDEIKLENQIKELLKNEK